MTGKFIFRAGLLLVTLSLSIVGCKKEETTENKPAPQTTEKAADKPKDEVTLDKAPGKVAEGADSIVIVAKHEPAKPDDPVEIEIKNFKVVSATFDPKNLNGASAELELDLGSIDSGLADRDKHVKSPDFLDVAAFGTAAVKISEVKKDGEAYAAQAEVTAHGVTAKFPVTFRVTRTTDDSVSIQGEHTFKRSDFKLHEANKAPVSQDLTIKMALTLKKS